MTLSTQNNNKINEISEPNKTINIEDLKINFPSTHKSKEHPYSGKCNYCGVEINFSDLTQVKIKTENKEESVKFTLYHNGCFQRYMRRTID